MTCTRCHRTNFRLIEVQAYAHYECVDCAAEAACSSQAVPIDLSRPWGMHDHFRRAMQTGDLAHFLSFTGFSYADHYRGEATILNPQLEALGFTSIRFYNIEADSFGPLVRGCSCIDSTGKPRRFSYA